MPGYCNMKNHKKPWGVPQGGGISDNSNGSSEAPTASLSGIQHDVADCPMAEECKEVCKPLHCSFGEWAEWSEASCLGLCERQRVVQEMNNECGTPCIGALHETKSCPSPCHPPVDCELSEWNEWTACSNASDGFVGGQRYRERKVKTPPKDGGLACYGDMAQTKACKGDWDEIWWNDVFFLNQISQIFPCWLRDISTPGLGKLLLNWIINIWLYN